MPAKEERDGDLLRRGTRATVCRLDAPTPGVPGAHSAGVVGHTPGMRLVVALGGNALLRRGEPMTVENQRTNVQVAAEALAPVAMEHELVITHGNGPQVGLLALQGAAYHPDEAFPLDVLGAETEGLIGYLIEQELGNLLPFEKPLATLLTMVEVDPSDPAFANPTKFVGPVYEKQDADALAVAKGWHFKLDGEVWRRVVPSPRAEADLRAAAGPVAARAGCRRHRRWRWRHPDDVPAGDPHAGRGRGGRRQGPRQRLDGAADRRRRVRRRDRRRCRVRRLGHRPPARASPGSVPDQLAQMDFRRRVDGPEGRRRVRLRPDDQASGPDR